MIEDGVLKNHSVDCAVGLHLWSQAPTGTIIANGGPFMASTDELTITVRGQGGHGAVPHSSRDPIVAAAHIVTALQTVVSRRTDPARQVVLTLGSMHGGEAFNVIPSEVRMGGTVRTFDRATQKRTQCSIEDVVRGTASAHGVHAEACGVHMESTWSGME